MSIDILLPRRAVKSSWMSYREAGDPGAPVALFLHGNPTSSFIWRNILPLAAPVAHCIAPDLIGFGQSGKPAIEYRFQDHVEWLDAFIEETGIKSAFLVAQDWGSGLAFHLAARRPDFVRGLAFMEFIHPTPSWNEFLQTEDTRDVFRKFRTPDIGEKMILEDNLFVEAVMPNAIMRTLEPAEMEAYRTPFPTPESRLPVWRFPNELPIENNPPDVYRMMTEAHQKLAAASYPKLLFAGSPGALISPAFAEEFAAKLPNCRLVQLGSGAHYLQEDHPETIGREVAGWISANA